ncbi:hypothetical protein RI367_002271 [Sorochytrium milnesiophthora]
MLRRINYNYQLLQSLGFASEHIRTSMQKAAAWDLSELLDWLCLTLDHEELPRGFADKFYFDKQQAVVSARRGGAPTEKVDGSAVLATPIEKKNGEEDVFSTKGAPRNSDKVKAAILARFAYEDTEEATPDPSKTGDAGAVPFDDVRSLSMTDADPSELHARYRLEHFEMKRKDGGSKSGVAAARGLIQEKIQALEDHPRFDKAAAAALYKELMQRSVAATKEKALQEKLAASTPAEPETNAGDDIGFDVFAETTSTKTATSPPPPKAPAEKSRPITIRSLVTTGWTGKVPKQLLQDTLRREDHYVKILYSELRSPRGIRAKCTVKPGQGEPVEFRMKDEACETKLEAEQYAAARRPLHRMLPPAYRDLWLEWEGKQQDEEESAKAAEEEERAKFFLDTWTMWKHKTEAQQQHTAAAAESARAESGRRYRRGRNQAVDRAYLGQFMEQQRTLQHKRYLEIRQTLPVYQYRSEILDMVRNNQVSLICGETGSGKSTQIAQFILEDMIESSTASTCSVLCAQPRRISAQSIAARVSSEMGDKEVGGANSWVGYSVRLESRTSDQTRLVFCTTGILLRRMELDFDLQGVSHVVVDEVHERSLDSDFLLTLLRKAMSHRPDLKVILMSATLEAERFSQYFNRCPVLNIPGRMFPVQVSFLADIVQQTGYVIEESSEFARRRLGPSNSSRLTISGARGKQYSQMHDWGEEEVESFPEDNSPSLLNLPQNTRTILNNMNPMVINYELIERLLEHVCIDDPETAAIEGAVLIFLPGLMEIRTCVDMLSRHPTFGDGSRYLLLPLHSSLTSEQQNAVFKVPPKGMRKIVCSTNIAETGVTIPDIVFVVDSGKAKETRYEESQHITKFEEVFISQANAKQRRGRAGRVRPGFCYHLFSDYRYEHLMRPYQVPEILRVPLDSTCLKIKVYRLGQIADAFDNFIEPPSRMAVDMAVERLVRVQALTPEKEQLTALGRHLGNLPVDVELGKLLLFGTLLRCLDPALTIAACLSHKSPFVRPFGAEEQADVAKAAFTSSTSDLITMYTAYCAWRRVYEKSVSQSRTFCRNNYLSFHNLIMIEEIKKQLLKYLINIKFVKVPRAAADQGTNKANSLCRVPPAFNTRDTLPVINLALTAAFYPNLLQMCAPSGDSGNPYAPTLRTTTDSQVYIHRTSIHFNRLVPDNAASALDATGLAAYASPWFIYYLKMKSASGKVYVWDATNVDGLAVIFMAGFAGMQVQHAAKYVTLDGSIRVKCFAKTATALRKLRQQMDAIFDHLIENPDAAMTEQEERILGMIVKVVSQDPLYQVAEKV